MTALFMPVEGAHGSVSDDHDKIIPIIIWFFNTLHMIFLEKHQKTICYFDDGRGNMDNYGNKVC